LPFKEITKEKLLTSIIAILNGYKYSQMAVFHETRYRMNVTWRECVWPRSTAG